MRTTRQKALRSYSRKRVVRALIKRDGLTCCFCGNPIDPDAAPNTPGRLSIEHVVRLADGGTNVLGNLKLAHRQCNSELADKTPGLLVTGAVHNGIAAIEAHRREWA